MECRRIPTRFRSRTTGHTPIRARSAHHDRAPEGLRPIRQLEYLTDPQTVRIWYFVDGKEAADAYPVLCSDAAEFVCALNDIRLSCALDRSGDRDC